MNQRFNPDTQNIKQWAEQVRLFELGKAMQELANGVNPTLVAEVMSVKITNKLLHPFMKLIKNINEE